MSQDTLVGKPISLLLHGRFPADAQLFGRHLLDLYQFAVQHYFQTLLPIFFRLHLLPHAE